MTFSGRTAINIPGNDEWLLPRANFSREDPQDSAAANGKGITELDGVRGRDGAAVRA